MPHMAWRGAHRFCRENVTLNNIFRLWRLLLVVCDPWKKEQVGHMRYFKLLYIVLSGRISGQKSENIGRFSYLMAQKFKKLSAQYWDFFYRNCLSLALTQVYNLLRKTSGYIMFIFLIRHHFCLLFFQRHRTQCQVASKERYWKDVSNSGDISSCFEVAGLLLPPSTGLVFMHVT